MCIHVSWRQPVCPWEAGPEAISCDIQVYQVLLRRSSGEFKTQQRIRFLVSPQLQSGGSLCVSSCNYKPRDQVFGQLAALEFTDPESTGHKLLSCAISLQIPKSGFGLHHP